MDPACVAVISSRNTVEGDNPGGAFLQERGAPHLRLCSEALLRSGRYARIEFEQMSARVCSSKTRDIADACFRAWWVELLLCRRNGDVDQLYAFGQRDGVTTDIEFDLPPKGYVLAARAQNEREPYDHAKPVGRGTP
jgi:hypothetical protein